MTIINRSAKITIVKKAETSMTIQKAIKSGYIDFGFGKIPVAVLRDGTRLITVSGFHRALGRSAPSGREPNRPANLPPFLAPKIFKTFISNELMDKMCPVQFIMPSGGKATGYAAENLPMICEVFLKARDAGVLTEKQLENASCADLIIRGLAHVGITALIDSATGYEELRDKTALQAILDKYLSKEAARWAKTFPDSFYLQIFRLKKWNPSKELRDKPGVVGRYTNDLVYKRLTPGLLDVLEEKNPVCDTGRRKSTHHQWLSKEAGIQHLKGHIFMLQKLMQSSESWEEFMRKTNDLLPYASTNDIEIEV